MSGRSAKTVKVAQQLFSVAVDEGLAPVAFLAIRDDGSPSFMFNALLSRDMCDVLGVAFTAAIHEVWELIFEAAE